MDIKKQNSQNKNPAAPNQKNQPQRPAQSPASKNQPQKKTTW